MKRNSKMQNLEIEIKNSQVTYENIRLKRPKSILLKFGKDLLWHKICKHFNKINKNSETNISFNIIDYF